MLVECSKVLTQSIATDNRISPAGEWLLDNFYLIDEQIRTAKRHLPKGYSRELPRLSNSPSLGLPRVYDIALEAVAHGDGRIDPEGLSRFVSAYQTVTPLKLGELWAIPIMLPLGVDRKPAAYIHPHRRRQNRPRPSRFLGQPDDSHCRNRNPRASS